MEAQKSLPTLQVGDRLRGRLSGKKYVVQGVEFTSDKKTKVLLKSSDFGHSLTVYSSCLWDDYEKIEDEAPKEIELGTGYRRVSDNKRFTYFGVHYVPGSGYFRKLKDDDGLIIEVGDAEFFGNFRKYEFSLQKFVEAFKPLPEPRPLPDFLTITKGDLYRHNETNTPCSIDKVFKGEDGHPWCVLVKWPKGVFLDIAYGCGYFLERFTKITDEEAKTTPTHSLTIAVGDHFKDNKGCLWVVDKTETNGNVRLQGAGIIRDTTAEEMLEAGYVHTPPPVYPIVENIGKAGDYPRLAVSSQGGLVRLDVVLPDGKGYWEASAKKWTGFRSDVNFNPPHGEPFGPIDPGLATATVTISLPRNTWQAIAHAILQDREVRDAVYQQILDEEGINKGGVE